MDQSVLIAALVFLLVVQAVMLASTGKVGERERIAHRLVKYTVPTWEGGLQTRISVLRRQRYSRLPWLDAILARFDLGDGISRQLQQAGLPAAGQRVHLSAAGAGDDRRPAGRAARLGDLWRPAGRAGRRDRRLSSARCSGCACACAQRRAAFEQGLPEALDRVTGALRAGYGLEYGFDVVAREGVPPCSEEFGQILQELNLGGDLEEALARLMLRVDSEDCATAGHGRGRAAPHWRQPDRGARPDGQMLRERDRLRRDVRVITTAPRVSGYVVALLPLLTVMAMYVTSRYYIDTLFSEPIGRLAAVAGGVLVLLGLYLNHRIAQVDL